MDHDRDQPVVVQLGCGEIPQAMAKNLVTFPKTSLRDESLQDLIIKREWVYLMWNRLIALVTTILDHNIAPAAELAALYHERWEIETALDELKTHLRGAQVVLRSKTPDLVKQEFYGFLMAHFAVRGLMHEAALKTDEDPNRLSFCMPCG